MTLTDRWLMVDAENLTTALRGAARNLEGNEGELVLDFTLVRRIDSSALQALEEFAGLAAAKGVKVVLCGVAPYVYRVLKLMKLTSRFSFADRGDDSAAAELESQYAQPSAK